MKWRAFGVKLAAVVLVVLMGLSYFLAQSAYWVNHSVFNQDAFTTKAQEVVLSQTSRDAIAETVVAQIFKGRPVADRLLGEKATSFISNLLGSDLAEQILNRSISRTYQYLTTADRQDIALELTTVKVPVAGLISFVENQGREVQFNPEVIPDRIVLLDAQALPDLSIYIRTFLIIGPLLWLLALASFIGYVLMRRTDRIRRLYIALAVLTGTTLLAFFVGPFIPNMLASFIQVTQLRVVVGDLATMFLQPFAVQLGLALLVFGLAALVVRFRAVFPKLWKSLTTSYTKLKKDVTKKQKRRK